MRTLFSDPTPSEEERRFRKASGHSSICNCVRRVRGKLLVTYRSCDCHKALPPEPPEDDNTDLRTQLREANEKIADLTRQLNTDADAMSLYRDEIVELKKNNTNAEKRGAMGIAASIFGYLNRNGEGGCVCDVCKATFIRAHMQLWRESKEKK